MTKNKKIREEAWTIILLAISGIYLLTIALISKGLYGDADSIAHFQLACYAFKYPYHFVDHWGKPLFTTLCAPFAQFGMQGAIFFNILCGLVTAWLVYRIAKNLNYRFALAAIPFTLFAPVYMINLFTSLTEILFALVLVAGIYCFVREKYILSAIIISFIPFARTEGLMFPVIFMLAFVLVKNYKAIPFLLTGFFVYSIAGYFHYKDFFWFFTAMPYGDKGSQIYGSGSFWFYLVNWPELMGIPLTILAILGTIYLVYRLFKDRRPTLTVSWITEYYLVSGSFFVFLLAQSLLWWLGRMGVLGSERFMACIMPLGGVLALTGFNFLLLFSEQRIWLKRLIIIVFTGVILWMPYYYHQIPSRLINQDKVMKETADALRKIRQKEERIIFFDPKLAYYLHEDPFDREKLYFRLSDNSKPEKDLADSTLLVWDTHFCEVGLKLSLDDMLSNSDFKLIDGFAPDKDLKFGKGQNYMSLIFRKLTSDKSQNDWIPLDSINFEGAETPGRMLFLTDTVAFTGSKSTRLNASNMYSFTLQKNLADISQSVKVIAKGSVKIFNPGRALPDNIILVISVNKRSGDPVRYYTRAASYYYTAASEWFEISIVMPINIDTPEDGSLNLFVWNKGKEDFFVDDLKLEYIPVNE